MLKEDLKMKCLELATASMSTPVDDYIVRRAQAFYDFVKGLSPEVPAPPEQQSSDTPRE